MQASPRLGLALAAAVVLLASAPAAGEYAGPQLTIVGEAPSAATFKEQDSGVLAEVAVTVRNDSRFSGHLRVRVVFDDGISARLAARPKRSHEVEMVLGKQRIRLRLGRRGTSPLHIGPRDVRRVKFQLRADPAPKSALTGTLVIAAGPARRISPATVPVTFQSEEEGSRWAEAKVKPDNVVIIVHRWLPSPIAPRALITDAQDVDVDGLTAGPPLAQDRVLLHEPVSSDTGGRGSVILSATDAVAAGATKTTLRVDARRLTRHGTYEAKLPLDPDLEKSPVLTVKVLARDLFIWPLLAILLGSLLAWRQLRDQEQRRPKEVLRLALKRLKELHKTNKEADKTSPVPYKLELFPDGDAWDDCANPQREAHQLWCKVKAADLEQELDDLTEAIAVLDIKVRAWPIARAKVKALNEASSKLPTRARAMRAACAKLATLDAAPAGKEETNEYFDQIEAQITAIDTWLTASRLLAEARDLHGQLAQDHSVDPDLLRRHDPKRWVPDLEDAASAADLERCSALIGICRDLHLLRSLVKEAEGEIVARGIVEISPEQLEALTENLGKDQVEGFAVAAPRVEPAPKVTPSQSVSDRLLGDIEAGDKRSFAIGFAIATLAYFVTIYNDTYGGLLDYLTAFVAGAGSMYLSNFRLLPWFRSYRPSKTS
ncbi:MAG: hypothetical protein QOG15_332 [Solirubrobacteraceae bacterium]|nr:hypothetical protein [Solirubrobacteraceae bacterium]